MILTYLIFCVDTDEDTRLYPITTVVASRGEDYIIFVFPSYEHLERTNVKAEHVVVEQNTYDTVLVESWNENAAKTK